MPKAASNFFPLSPAPEPSHSRSDSFIRMDVSIEMMPTKRASFFEVPPSLGLCCVRCVRSHRRLPFDVSRSRVFAPSMDDGRLCSICCSLLRHAVAILDVSRQNWSLGCQRDGGWGLLDAARTAARAWAPDVMECVLLCIFEQLETAICVDNYPIACPTQLPNFGVRLL
jgi:hypothetical protein